jgi:glutamine synthetase
VCLAAGLDGIKNKLDAPKGIDTNIFDMTDDEREFVGVEPLPSNLYEALQYLRGDKFVTGVLGSRIAKKYMEAKEAEWSTYRKQVTQWELDEYLNKY